MSDHEPRFTLKKDQFDQLMESLALVGLIGLIILPVVYYESLPELIPIHFGLDGRPDGFGPKVMIWLLPGIGGFSFVGMKILCRYPRLFNYPVKITTENARRQYRLAVRLIRILTATQLWLFCYLTNTIIEVALGLQDELNMGLLLLFLAGTFGTIGYYFWQSKKQD